MPTDSPLEAAHFYDAMPTSDHRPGDIWSNLPTFGSTPGNCCRAIVITPACDLANKKCESITYLPIISTSEYLGSSAFRNECWLEIQPLLARLNGYKELPQPGRFDLLPLEFLDFTKTSIDAAGKKLSPQELERLEGYRKYVLNANLGKAGAPHLANFIKADKLESILTKLVTNALKSDIHFLPADQLPNSYSAIPHHATVLFRYPLSIPIEILTRAQNTNQSEWENYRITSSKALPTLAHMQKWPIKLASLRSEFFADMISRYINMYIRLGSADFSEGPISNFTEQILEGK